MMPFADAFAQGIEEIIVTARKSSESLLSVPVAISAITAESIGQRGIFSYNQLNDFVPGLRYENSAANRNDRGFHTFAMRGMYPGDSPNRPGVTAFVDGVPIPGGAIPGLTEIERVEIVKGPQSAYFGRATFAGAINFVTREPGNEFGGSITASAATHGTVEVNANVEMPLAADKLAARVSSRYYSTDGRYNNFGRVGKLGAQKTWSGALNLVANPSDDLKIRAFYTAWTDKDGPSAQGALTEANYNCNAGGNGRPVNGLNYICGGIGAIPLNRIAQNTTPPVSPGLLTSGLVVEPDGFITELGLHRREYQANVIADYSLGDYTLSASAGRNHNRWAALTETYNRPPEPSGYYSTVYLPYDINNWSSEVRLTSPPTEAFKFMIGGNHYAESIFFQVRASRPPVGGPFTTLTVPTDYLAHTDGIFGSASYDITDALTLNGEARYQWDKIKHIQRIANGFVAENTFKSFSPRVILNYEIDDNANAYISFARGTRPGTFNINFLSLTAFQQAQIVSQLSVPLSIPEETLRTYEAGLKGDFMDRRLRILAAVYYGQWRDRQINQNFLYRATAAATTDSSITLTLANGSTNLWGLELESTFRATENLTFDATFNWAATSIRRTACAECVAISGVLNPVGNRMERYPALSGTLGTTYEQPIAGDWSSTFHVDYIYTGKQYATAANKAWLKPSNRFNAKVGVTDETFSVELYGKNIFDNKVPSNILRNANPNAAVTQGVNLIILAPPEAQTFGVRASAKF
ncbi:MAG: hypothetical protein EXR11_10480 [Rhodospirillaceae bacterium]|nr:hypothetical protein [Rhodospirillaceae bacterium]